MTARPPGFCQGAFFENQKMGGFSNIAGPYICGMIRGGKNGEWSTKKVGYTGFHAHDYFN